MRKRNKRNTLVSTDGYIKKYFGTEIGRILAPSSHSLQNSEIPYVSHPEAEYVLNDILEGDFLKDKSLVFTGLTGSGKTTILRRVFGLETNANKAYIKEDRIIISVDFNRSHGLAQGAFLSSLWAAVEAIVETYGIDFPDKNNEKFYEYIKERRWDVLCLNQKNSQYTTYVERMEEFIDELPTAFASLQLQYVMDHPVCDLRLVVLIVDNIEAFMKQNTKNTKSKYLLPVIEAFRLAECIHQRGNPTEWCFNMLIACRHHIWRIMKGEFKDNSQESALLQSYVATEKPYDLAKPVRLDAIIQKREDVFSRRQRNPEKWNMAVKVVNAVLQKMENGIGDFVVQLELKDIRKSLEKMQELILHKGLQRKTDDEIEASGAYQIDSIDQFDLSRVNLVRVIGLGDRKYYADSYSIIPNLLVNNHQEGFELYTLLTLNYFLIHCSYAEPDWDNPISIPEFYETVEYIFGKQDIGLMNMFVQAMHFLIQHRLLLRSADQPQDEVPGLSLAEVKKVEYVYVSGAAVKLWEELGKSSALFQLFLDDIWLDDNTDFFEEDGNDIEHCVEYVKILWQAEKRMYNRARNRSLKYGENYINVFGKVPVCRQLVNGLLASLKAITAWDDFKSQDRIEKAKETQKKVEDILDELLSWEREKSKNLT